MNHVKFWESQDLILIDVWNANFENCSNAIALFDGFEQCNEQFLNFWLPISLVNLFLHFFYSVGSG